jgi:SPP1 gp7 family putative phage head morphogenesis protein
MPHIFDAKNKKAPIIIIPKKDSPFQRSKGIQTIYERALRGVAKEVGKLVSGYASEDPLDQTTISLLEQALRAYSDLISPWALHLSSKILGSVDNQDRNAWRQHSKNMAIALRKEIENAPTGETLKDLMNENVTLIKSIPLEAAKRVHNLIQENMMQSGRATEIAAKIMKTEYVTKSRATLIARTEIARASTLFTQARSQHIGADSYIWHTSRDLIVRKSHREVNGKEFYWDKPPTLSDGTTTHPGAIYNCRCFPEPLVPER